MAKTDERTFIQVHDGLPDHPKVEPLSDAAFRLLVELWCYCSRHLTDGLVTRTAWQKRGTARARKELLDAGLAVTYTDGDVLMHDYLAHQRSAADVQAAAEAREDSAGSMSRGGQLSTHNRWHRDRGIFSANCTLCPPSEPIDEVAISTSVSKPLTVVSEPSISSRKQEEEEEEEKEKEQELSPPTASAGRSARSTKRKTKAPETFEVTPELRAWARENHLTDVNLTVETQQWLDYHRAKGTTGLDWSSSWRYWMRNTSKYGATATKAQRTDQGGGW